MRKIRRDIAGAGGPGIISEDPLPGEMALHVETTHCRDHPPPGPRQRTAEPSQPRGPLPSGSVQTIQEQGGSTSSTPLFESLKQLRSQAEFNPGGAGAFREAVDSQHKHVFSRSQATRELAEDAGLPTSGIPDDDEIAF
jgi:hypothetical protein